MDTTTAPDSTPITFYDIAHKPPVTKSCFSPNPWKSRFALNFKAVPYTTSWVRMPDIPQTRRSLGLLACRKFADGTDFYTLPVVRDASTGVTLGDSFDIAIYLQRTYPDSGAGDLFPAQKLDYTFVPSFALAVPLSERADGGYSEYYRFNTSVDAAFTSHVPLMVSRMPFDPETEEQTKAEFMRRAGVKSWDDFALTSEAREKLMQSFEAALSDLARLYRRDDSGPFLLGKQASYADFIVGAWLRMSCICLPESEWDEVRSWHDGVLGKLHDGLEAYAEVK
ncbi:hypothetical protein BBK36DRAFT_1201754 [Trichoderma citrinoviride]|uniref:GST N-terminal domain-containing protein n=1 Tax=Trichoderma citrinoviride TaxID=58853 RepID=A0A2T4BBD7_9HYPO|nr:hypothetical protein BBK36DRAFT_1201754 [Trichoderma citrinoviride]PTB66598.1 hypothetical protein BBK36DRAFT_1201754 [Trichoderma citrinoviride]